MQNTEITIGENVQYATDEKGRMHFIVDPKNPGHASKSGKSMLVATTHKGATINGLNCGINIWGRIEGEPKAAATKGKK